MKTIRVGSIDQYKDYNAKTLDECIDKIKEEYINTELNNIHKLKLDFVFEEPDAITRLAIMESFEFIDELKNAKTVKKLSSIISSNSINDSTEVIELKIKQSKPRKSNND